MLEVKKLSAAYGQHPSLNEVDITVAPGEIVVILGANGAGKSTLLRAIAGICKGKVHGQVNLAGRSLLGKGADEIVEHGIALVPEGRGIFGDLTVTENLLLGAYSPRARAKETENLDRVLKLFPKLRERQGQIARTMSGGAQQMVAIGRAMMSAPEILLLDEPSLGLSPLLCKELFHNLALVKDLGIGVLLVEQNAKQSLAIADRVYLLENTRITHDAAASQLMNDPAVQKAYLGAGSKSAAKQKKLGVIEEVPNFLPISASPLPRRTADQQIGGSIDDLVAIASKASANAPRALEEGIANAADRLVRSRIEVVLKDIETAANAARSRKIKAPSRPPISFEKVTVSDGPTPFIEVYKRPRVEVYRRRPSGQFERD